VVTGNLDHRDRTARELRPAEVVGVARAQDDDPPVEARHGAVLAGKHHVELVERLVLVDPVSRHPPGARREHAGDGALVGGAGSAAAARAPLIAGRRRRAVRARAAPRGPARVTHEPAPAERAPASSITTRSTASPAAAGRRPSRRRPCRRRSARPARRDPPAGRRDRVHVSGAHGLDAPVGARPLLQAPRCTP